MLFHVFFIFTIWLSAWAATDIPSAFSSGFNTAAATLQIIYNGKEVADGSDLSNQDTSNPPTFALGDSSGLSTTARYIILMIDPDVSKPSTSPQTLHFMQQDFQANGDNTELGLQLSSKSSPTVSWAGPSNAQGSGTHRFVFLLFQQPQNFQMQAVSSSTRDGFDVFKWSQANGLKSAVAGIEFISTVSGGSGETSSADSSSQAASSTSSSSSTTSTSSVVSQSAQSAQSSGGTVIDVDVGGSDGKLVYHPESVTAGIGDTVRFNFLAKNHTVTQSTFQQPCTGMQGGTKSGFKPNLENISGKQMFNFSVTDTMPKWFFCGQTGHCGQGMVFAINPGSKFDAFKQAALAIGASSSTTSSSVSASSTSDTSLTESASFTSSASDTSSTGSASPTSSMSETTVVASSATSTAAGPPVQSPSSSLASVIKVTVGGAAGNVYTPEQVTANVGDTVVFDFRAKNHTVTQSTLASPCNFMTGGFKSGFMPNLEDIDGMVTMEFNVTDTNPTWFYCAQTGHCAQGMVFAINPGTKFAQFKAAAISSGGSPSGNSSSNSTASAPSGIATQTPGSSAIRLRAGWVLSSCVGIVVLMAVL